LGLVVLVVVIHFLVLVFATMYSFEILNLSHNDDNREFQKTTIQMNDKYLKLYVCVWATFLLSFSLYPPFRLFLVTGKLVTVNAKKYNLKLQIDLTCM
jgi:hypothetical protein